TRRCGSSYRMTKRWADRSHGRVKSRIVGDCSYRPKPQSTVKPPTYIGLRTNWYGPAATNLRGGSNGAGVPSPQVTNVTTQANARVPPAVISTMPKARVQPVNANPKVVS